MITFTLRQINQVIKGYVSPPKINPNKTVNISYRCWPIDVDAFLHMNNSKYLQLAELSRWRTLGPMFPRLFDFKKERLLFLAVENKIKYLRPIQPFERYVISTSITVDETDKWVYYRHVFEEHPDDMSITSTSEMDKGATRPSPRKFAVVDMKSVVKRESGKTVRPSTLIDDSNYFQEWVSRKEENIEE
jgi:acyl-CoA thioesterase FadM